MSGHNSNTKGNSVDRGDYQGLKCVVEMQDVGDQPKTSIDTTPENRQDVDGNVPSLDVEKALDDSSAKELDGDITHSGNRFTEIVEETEKHLKDFFKQNGSIIRLGVYVLLILLYIAYLIFVLSLDFHRASGLLIMTLVAVSFAGIWFVKNRYGTIIHKHTTGPMVTYCKTRWRIFQWVVYLGVVAFLILSAAVTGVFGSVANEPERLVSILGLIAMLGICFLCSKYPGKIRWRTVFWGLSLQLFLGIIILRTRPGFVTFNWLGHNVEVFLNYTNVGAEFVFGPKPLEYHQFIFIILPVIIFSSSVFSLLYHWGVMQFLINGFAFVMHYTMGISGAESFACASNIFVGMTVAPLAIKPYLPDMTTSELHSVIVGGFATIAGSVLAVYISFGISASHLLTASIMSAPAAMVTAKIFYPEINRPKTAGDATVVAEKGDTRNALEAVYVGAADGLKICGYILANILAILSIVAFINAVLSWLGGLANVPHLSFQLICRYLLYPIAWLLGTGNHEECLIVAELIGTKTFLNEFIAYTELAEYSDAGKISTRSEVIATYALCGFSNLGSLGVMLGGMIPLVPHRKSEVSQTCIRALVAATIACLMTASVAGLLYQSDSPESAVEANTNTTTVATMYTT